MYMEQKSSSSIALKIRTDTEPKNTDTSGQIYEKKPYSPEKSFADNKKAYDFIKRAFDICCSFAAIIVLFIPIAVICIAIMVEKTGKSPLYKQKRLGKNGKLIYIYKFRSMVDNADDIEKWLTPAQIRQYYNEYKVENDPRVTKVGKFLRRTGLDELPQLLNILKGDLSVVGPRPVQDSETELYGDKKDLLLSVKPGLTGYWQVYCSSDTTYGNKKRQQMELYYVTHRSLALDLKIFFSTFGALIRKFKRGQ